MAKRTMIWLGERATIGTVRASRVDREAGIIYGCKVLGYESKNGRRYLPEAVKAAANLYEGCSVRTNHPRRATDQRGVEEVFGWLESVEVRDDGMYADLHVLNPKTTFAESVFLAAEKKPDLFGLSHNAHGATEQRGSETLVVEITSVASVDLVSDPATVDSLFEGLQPMKLKAFFESLKLPKQLNAKGKARLAKLFEDGTMDPALDAPVEAPAADAGEPDHVAALKGGFKAACVAALEDPGLDVAGKVKKLKEILQAEEKLLAKGEPVKEDDDEPEETDKDEELEECEDDDVKESKNLRLRLKKMETREQVRDLCESENFTPSKSLFNALVALPESDRKALIAEQKGKEVGEKRRPRNQSVNEGKNTSTGSTADIKDGKGFAERLRNGAFSG